MASEVVTKGSKRLKLSPNRAEDDEDDVKRRKVIDSGQSTDDTISDEKTIEPSNEEK